MPEIVVYGGELAGVAAALAAARRAPAGTEVTLLYPEGAPGGGSTLGGHCGWERRPWQHGGRREDPQGGSFAVWLREIGPVYQPEAFAARLSGELQAAGVTVLAGHELEAVLPPAGAAHARPRGRRAKGSAPLAEIVAVRIRPVVQGDGGLPALAEGDEAAVTLQGRVFIDASATGRLARLAGVPLSVGRTDWNPDGRQMAAGLLLAVERLDWEALTAARDGQDKPIWGTALEETPAGPRRVFWGGAGIAANDAVLQAFAGAHPGFRLGAPRAWEEGGGVFWISALLAHNVDGRRRCYDAGTDRDVEPVPPLSRDIDTAYHEARALAAAPDMLGALRRFPGLGEVRFAERGGVPRCGQVLLLRETVHSLGLGPDSFAVRAEDLTGAGSGPADGIDARHRARRVGLGFAWLENAGYTHGEVARTTSAATNPAYLPLDAILTPPVANLLVPGHAARVESRAWWALRTAPNLCVLGDAAGVAAAFSAREEIPVLRFSNPEVAALQSWLAADGARLDK